MPKITRRIIGKALECNTAVKGCRKISSGNSYRFWRAVPQGKTKLIGGGNHSVLGKYGHFSLGSLPIETDAQGLGRYIQQNQVLNFPVFRHSYYFDNSGHNMCCGRSGPNRH
jgi:hypothetical protein